MLCDAGGSEGALGREQSSSEKNVLSLIGARTHLREPGSNAPQRRQWAKSSLLFLLFLGVLHLQRFPKGNKFSSAFSPCACRVDFAFAVVQNNMSAAQQGSAHSPVSSNAPSPSPGIVHHEGGMSTLVRSHPSLINP